MKKTKWKNIVSFGLCAAMALNIAACSSGGTAPAESGGGAAPATAAAGEPSGEAGEVTFTFSTKKAFSILPLQPPGSLWIPSVLW